MSREQEGIPLMDVYGKGDQSDDPLEEEEEEPQHPAPEDAPISKRRQFWFRTVLVCVLGQILIVALFIAVLMVVITIEIHSTSTTSQTQANVQSQEMTSTAATSLVYPVSDMTSLAPSSVSVSSHEQMLEPPVNASNTPVEVPIDGKHGHGYGI